MTKKINKLFLNYFKIIIGIMFYSPLIQTLLSAIFLIRLTAITTRLSQKNQLIFQNVIDLTLLGLLLVYWNQENTNFFLKNYETPILKTPRNIKLTIHLILN